MTNDSNKVMVSTEAEALDVTTFGSGGYRKRIGGLKTVEASIEGFITNGSGEVGPELFPHLGVADEAFTVAPIGTAATTAKMFLAGKFKVSEFGAIGDAAPFSVDAMGTNNQGLVTGQVAKAKGDVSGTGQLGSILNITGPTATQYVYCTVHIFSAGTTVTLQLQSDSAVGFSSPTTQATIGPLTTSGGTWMTRVAGALSGEDYWRLNVSAITGTFSVGAAIAVGS